MNVEPIIKISELTRYMVYISEKLNGLVQLVEHEELQNTLKEMTMNLQIELLDMNNLCYEVLNSDGDDIVTLINNCG